MRLHSVIQNINNPISVLLHPLYPVKKTGSSIECIFMRFDHPVKPAASLNTLLHVLTQVNYHPTWHFLQLLINL